MYGWASDNWRETMVFNYNNYYLVEISVLYDCLVLFLTDTPVQNFFAGLLQPLASNAVWMAQNRGLGIRFDLR